VLFKPVYKLLAVPAASTPTATTISIRIAPANTLHFRRQKRKLQAVAGDQVVTTFGADDNAFQAAARRVMDSMRGIGQFKPPAGPS
jgi:hypothetical protein